MFFIGMIVGTTFFGWLAGRVSKYRPMTPIIALTTSKQAQRHLTLRWGVTPITIPKLHNVEDFFSIGEQQAIAVGGVKTGNLVVLVAGLPIGVPGGTNLLRVLTISERLDGE